MLNYELATIEAHSLLQINPANRDDEWENDRREWLVKWESKLVEVNTTDSKKMIVCYSCEKCRTLYKFKKQALKCCL